MSHQPSTTYPYVIKTSDPLLIRFDKLSLLVGSCNFWIEVQTGAYFTGFKVFISGMGHCVFKKSLEGTSTKQLANGVVVNISKDSQIAQIESEAVKWLNDLEISIADKHSDNPLSVAIDNLRWQMHYDMTKSSADIPVELSIDKSAQTLIDMTSSVVQSVDTLDDNLSADTASKTGSIIKTRDEIATLNTALNDSTTGSLVSVASRIAPSGSTAYGGATAIADNLRDTTNGEYTISKALRDTTTGDSSVSNATYQQTQLISSEFNSVNSNLGTVSDSTSTNTVNGKLNKVNALVGSSSDTTTATLFGYNKVLNDNISSSGSSSAGDISTIKTNVNTIMTRMGSATDSRNANTLGGKLNDVNTKLGDTQNAGNIWWDILHNAGTSPNTAGYDPNSVVDKIIQAVS